MAAERERNEVWDACVEVLGYGPKTDSERKLWGKMVASLTRGEATADRIRSVNHFYRKNWPNIDLTITALEKWYSHFLAMEEKRKQKGLPVAGLCKECQLGGGYHADGCSFAPPPPERTGQEERNLEMVRELTKGLRGPASD